MRLRFKFGLVLAAVIISFSAASALAPLPAPKDKEDTAQKEPASKFQSDLFNNSVAAPEEDPRLGQGVNGSAGVSNPLPGPATVKQPNVAVPPYPGPGSSYRDQPPPPGAPGYPSSVYPDPDKKPKGGGLAEGK